MILYPHTYDVQSIFSILEAGAGASVAEFEKVNQALETVSKKMLGKALDSAKNKQTNTTAKAQLLERARKRMEDQEKCEEAIYAFIKSMEQFQENTRHSLALLSDRMDSVERSIKKWAEMPGREEGVCYCGREKINRSASAELLYTQLPDPAGSELNCQYLGRIFISLSFCYALHLLSFICVANYYCLLFFAVAPPARSLEMQR